MRKGKGQKVRARLPYAPDNRDFLRDGRRAKPEWVGDGAYWEIPRAWFSDLAERCIARYGKVYVVQAYREHEVCAPACWNAKGPDCQCSCLGANHGANNDDRSWKVISDTLAVRRGEEQLAVRLLGQSSSGAAPSARQKMPGRGSARW